MDQISYFNLQLLGQMSAMDYTDQLYGAEASLRSYSHSSAHSITCGTLRNLWVHYHVVKMHMDPVHVLFLTRSVLILFLDASLDTDSIVK
jgi:hypothetical protein